VTTTQGWLLIGVPTLLAGIVLYTMRSPRLGAIGLLVITAGAFALATVDRASGAALGAVVALLYAAGRAGGGAAVGSDPVRRNQRDSAPD
jgi:hypothetical protein